ncbi:tyrosine-protein phosphatase non-receptor type substrate 1-like [Elgaria multicarinata webbii]|uniref:tyrosine-protein phosphatase non-receptor type substrate 1-like n=1 Tax=Elgaria multicarinata webbii TaxID=159646 RepID=UPI002FCD1BB8
MEPDPKGRLQEHEEGGNRKRGAEPQEVKVVQPEDDVSVTAGGTLRLKCTVTVGGRPGPVKWFLGEGPSRKLIYAGVGKFERVMKEYQGSSTDFTILIRNVSLEDTGTYYCVKQKAGHNGDTDVECGPGTKVLVTEGDQNKYLIPAAAGAACVLLAAFVSIAIYFYAKKKRGE